MPTTVREPHQVDELCLILPARRRRQRRAALHDSPELVALARFLRDARGPVDQAQVHDIRYGKRGFVNARSGIDGGPRDATQTRVWSWSRFRQTFQPIPSCLAQENSTRLKHARNRFLKEGTHWSRWFKSGPALTDIKRSSVRCRVDLSPHFPFGEANGPGHNRSTSARNAALGGSSLPRRAPPNG
jgi:hypothetical protein